MSALQDQISWVLISYIVAAAIATPLTQIVLARLLQGLLGAALVPLSQAIMLDTNPKEKHAQAMAIYSLSRNIGSSIGISVMQTLLTRNTALFHSQMVEHINPAIQAVLPAVYNLATPQGLAALNNEVTRQASFLATLNDFKIMMVVTLLFIPLLLMRKQSHAPTPPVEAHPME